VLLEFLDCERLAPNSISSEFSLSANVRTFWPRSRARRGGEPVAQNCRVARLSAFNVAHHSVTAPSCSRFLASVQDAHDNLLDRFHLAGIALRNHQCNGGQGIPIDHGRFVPTIQYAVCIEEIEEYRCGNPLVSINEGMVFDNQVEKRGSLFLNRGVEFPSPENLIDLAYGTPEGIILFTAE